MSYISFIGKQIARTKEKKQKVCKNKQSIEVYLVYTTIYLRNFPVSSMFTRRFIDLNRWDILGIMSFVPMAASTRIYRVNDN